MARALTYRFHLLLALAVVVIATGCSTEKDAFLNRTYHRLTARDNGWFNANEKLKETIDGIERSYEDNYDEVLPIFVYGTDAQAKSAVPELEICIEKCALVIDRHSMRIKDKERNAWIDDAHFVIGKAQFYKRAYSESQRMFGYIAQRYKDQDKALQAKLWEARTFTEMENYAKARSSLDEIIDEKEFPKRFPQDELAAVQADLDLSIGKVDDAIVHLERAVDLAKDKDRRVRWAFILAQLYEAKNMEQKAIEQYSRVVRMNPPYEIAFHAQIFQALAFDHGNSEGLRKKLGKMLRDEKHLDHYDMIHFALAELDFKENNDSSAVAHLKESSRLSTIDTKQKARTFLRLADHYFDDREYTDAQLYYDSTVTVLAEVHPRYEEVVVRADVLGELVEQLQIIALEDSLQALASMDEDEREKVIRRMIRERKEEAEEKERLETAARDAVESGNAPIRPAATTGGGGAGGWYFNNPQTMARGMADFRKRWGKRELEDDWRRKDRTGSAAADLAEQDIEQAEEKLADGAKDGEPEWMDPQFYLKDLPNDPVAIAASDARICEAMYTAGMIYKEKLRDISNAEESFEVLYNRFDECRYTPESVYQLYRIYLEKERAEGFIDFGGAGSSVYANIIMDRWPNSEFARLVQNPDKMQADELTRQEEEAAYKAVYERFRMRDYTSVISSCTNVIAEQPRNHLIPKYYMLRAMAIGGTRQISAFRDALNEVKAKFPGTDEEKAATQLLAALDSETPGTPPSGQNKSETPFREDAGKHYFTLIVPNADGPIDAVKTKIANFNTLYFPGMNIQISNSFLDPQHQVVLLSLFDNRKKAMEYYDMFLSNTDQLLGVNDRNYPTFAISPDNYSALFKNKDVDGYAAFFTATYLKGQ